MMLSPHFSLESMIRSQTAARLGIDNTPPPEITANLTLLCDDVLEKFRTAIGSKPVFVSSGYRCPALNAATPGSSKTSDHVLGLAADIEVEGMTLEEIGGKLRTLAPFLPIKQVILEFGAWVHVSRVATIAPNGPPPEFLVSSRVNGETVYTPWES